MTRQQTEVSDAAIADAVGAEAGYMEELLSRLVEAPTLLGNEEPGQELMRGAFRELGLAPVDVPLDETALRAHPTASPFSWDVSGKTNVVAAWSAHARSGAGEAGTSAPGRLRRAYAAGQGGRSLVLNGHIDVVPASESLWRTAPFKATREGDWLYGRGAGDMKAGLAAIVGAVRGLRALGLDPCAPVYLQSVVEEECTGNGALQCVLTGPNADAAVITEPFPGAITTAQVGVLWFQVELAGIPAHVGEAAEGVNAIEAVYPVIAALRALEVELNESPPPPYDELEHPINLNVGTIRGGDWPSTVASACTVAFRLSLYPGQRVDELQRRVEATVAAAVDGSLSARVTYDGFACEGTTVSGGATLVRALGDAHARLEGTRPALIASTATTDARAFIQACIPAVCFGPHAESIHGVDERVSISSTIRTAQVLGVFVRDWCGVTG
jgi:acetylornithine deacetylase